MKAYLQPWTLQCGVCFTDNNTWMTFEPDLGLSLLDLLTSADPNDQSICRVTMLNTWAIVQNMIWKPTGQTCSICVRPLKDKITNVPRFINLRRCLKLTLGTGNDTYSEVYVKLTDVSQMTLTSFRLFYHTDKHK